MSSTPTEARETVPLAKAKASTGLLRAGSWLIPPVAAVQFLTRLPVPALAWTDDTLPRALPFFPLVGAGLGLATAGVDRLLAPHLSANVAALTAIALLIVLTGALHEDGLADCADAFGLRHSHVRTLEILHDSRIGTFGALALMLSVGLRVLLVAGLPPAHVLPALVAALTLSRWSVLPLALLPPVSTGSTQGARVAGSITRARLLLGSSFALAITCVALRLQVLPAIASAILVMLLCGRFFRRRLGGVTGDCFGATIQLVELAVLLTAAWSRQA